MRSYFVIFLLYFILVGCADKVICPAFQSTYILDDSTRYAYYSYVWKLDETSRQEYLASLKKSDTATTGGIYTTESEKMMPYYAYAEQIVPPAEQVNKTKYGIVKYEPYWLKNYRLRKAPMENVLGPETEVEEPVDVGEFVASDFGTDSLAADSLAVAAGDSLAAPQGTAVASAAKKKERKYLYGYREDDNFNVEQEYYNKYFGKQLVDNRPEPKEIPAEPDSVTQKASFWDFFKNIFSNFNNSDTTSNSSSEGLPENLTEPELPQEESDTLNTPEPSPNNGNF